MGCTDSTKYPPPHPSPPAGVGCARPARPLGAVRPRPCWVGGGGPGAGGGAWRARPPVRGASARELLAAPNSGPLSPLSRALLGVEADEHLLNIYSLPGL